MGLKSEAVVRRCSVKKVSLKIFKNYQNKYLCRSRESLVRATAWEFCRIFRNICFVEHLWTHTCVKWGNKKYFDINIFTENRRWWCSSKYSCRFKGLAHVCLQFYLKRDSVTDTFVWNLWGFAELQFYTTLQTLINGQLLLISSNIFDVPLLLAIYQFSHN